MLHRRHHLTLWAVLSVLAGTGFLLLRGQGAGGDMATAADRFLESLQEEQRQKATMEFDSEKRLDWHFIPKPERKGLQIKDMSAQQRKVAHDLLKTGLSELGYDKAVTIMDLEFIVRELERDRKGGNIRDPERYYFTIFGKPAAEGTWGWSVEGHHLSLNYVVTDGKCTSVTPLFMGANPAEVRADYPVGPKKGTRVLGPREEMGFKLLAALDDEQRKTAIIHEKAPADVRSAGEPQPPEYAADGLAAKAMTEEQRTLLEELLKTYTATMPKDIAERRWSEVNEAGIDKVYFAWAGAQKPGVGHYYRVQGPTFLVEFCNNQPDAAGNPANHSHSIWRQAEGDFGLARKK